jgi:uncharacterized BrkB/YihY/UPF0761 family membrane protein
MSNKAFEWLQAALILNTMQIGFGLYEIYIRQIEPAYAVFSSFMPGVVLNIIMFVYLLRRKGEIIVVDEKDKK